jgi:hypothetical protein
LPAGTELATGVLDERAGTRTRWYVFTYTCVILAAIYLPALGRGFIRDDLRWIVAGRLQGVQDGPGLFLQNVGFYRPLVSLSFGLDYLLFQLHPFGYGLTNFALLIACVFCIGRLGLLLGLEPAFAGVAGALWALNFHGIGGAVLWLSGRTALLLTLFAVLALSTWLRDEAGWAAIWLTLALFSKEEAVLLPLIVPVAASLWPTRSRWRLHLSVALVVLAGYLALRWHSGAFWPASAPPYYQLTARPAALSRNILEYVDRSATFSACIVLALALYVRQWPRLRQDWRFFTLAATWVVLGFGLTLFVPARSSLYVVFPSVGVCLSVALIAERLWHSQTVRTRRHIVFTSLVIPCLLLPVYYARNRLPVRLATLSQELVETLRRTNTRIGPHTVVVVSDDRSTHANLSNAIGTQVGELRELAAPKAAALWIEPPPEGAELAGLTRPATVGPVVTLRIVSGHVAGDPAH